MSRKVMFNRVLFVVSAVSFFALSMLQSPDGRLVLDSEASCVFGAYTPVSPQLGVGHSGYSSTTGHSNKCSGSYYPASCGGTECGTVFTTGWRKKQLGIYSVTEDGTHCSEKTCGGETKICGEVDLIECGVVPVG